MRIAILLVLAALVAWGADNTLTPGERADGYTLLFDGRTMNGWRNPASETPPGDSWVIENGCLKTRLRPRITEDLVSAESYGDFELKFDWRMSVAGNSGVKYRIQRLLFLDNTKLQRGEGGFEGEIAREVAHPVSDRATMAPEAKGGEYVIGFEFQLLDDDRHPDGRVDASHRTGALYGMIPPLVKAANPVGEWNESRLVVKGQRVEHWINGVKVMEGSLASEAVKAGAEKRWGRFPLVAEMFTKPKRTGPISLQHHGDEVWFKNIKIRVFD